MVSEIISLGDNIAPLTISEILSTKWAVDGRGSLSINLKKTSSPNQFKSHGFLSHQQGGKAPSLKWLLVPCDT